MNKTRFKLQNLREFKDFMQRSFGLCSKGDIFGIVASRYLEISLDDKLRKSSKKIKLQSILDYSVKESSKDSPYLPEYSVESLLSLPTIPNTELCLEAYYTFFLHSVLGHIVDELIRLYPIPRKYYYLSINKERHSIIVQRNMRPNVEYYLDDIYYTKIGSPVKNHLHQSKTAIEILKHKAFGLGREKIDLLWAQS